MKKFIAMLLLFTMCIGAFVGCNNNKNEANVDLENAKTYVFNMYNGGASKDEAIKILKDKEVISSVPVDGVTYTIEWTVNVTAGAADSVKIADGKNGNKLVDITEGSEEQIDFTLTATIKAPNGETATVSFKFFVPKTEKADITDGKVITLYNPSSESYVTGKGILYTSSSGSVKDELEISKNKADAIALTLITNADGTVTFKTADGKFLYGDATHVKFVDAEGQYTKFTIEAAEGGSYIKTAGLYQNNPEKPQYLEIYSGCLTVYGISATSDLAIYTFVMQDAEGANGTVVPPAGSGNQGGNEGGNDNTGDGGNTSAAPTLTPVTPVAGTAYKFAFVQGNKNAAYYLIGVLKGYYMDSTDTFANGVDYYVEATTGGYHFYCMVGGAKKYVNVVVNGTHVNGVYEDAASTVYTYDETLKTLVTKVDGTDYIFGTKNSDTFTTLGPMKVSDNPFYAQFVTTAATPGSTGGNEGGNDNTGDGGNTSAAPTLTPVTPVAGTAYKFAFVQGNKNAAYYLIGVLKGYYMDSTDTFANGVDYYVEATTGGYHFYCMVGGAKKYVNVVVNGTHVNGVYEDAASTVYTYDETLKTLVTKVDGTDYIFGTKNSDTFTTLGPMKVSDNPFYAQFVTTAATPGSTGGNEGGNQGGNTNVPAGSITFDFGANGSAGSHQDGNDIGTTKTYTSGNYTLEITAGHKAYDGGFDKAGNSIFKLGTSSVVGTVTFVVPDEVKSVIVYAARYKGYADNNIVVINGTSYTLTKNSDDGQYEAITIDTTTNKTVTIASSTDAAKPRCVINDIVWVIG